MEYQQSTKRILVTGATGYIGGRLIPRLLKKGYRIRAVARTIEKLKSQSWADNTNIELVAGDMLSRSDVDAMADGCDIVYYLVHSMVLGQKDFESSDRLAAENMVAAAAEKKVGRIIYLGGLGEIESKLSKHLRSRNEVAQIFLKAPVSTTIFRAAVILGSGGASFEILRYLVEHLPVMITPRWLRTPSQPVAISNVLHYLIECLDVTETEDGVFDIGGPEVITYKQMMDTYGRVAGLRKRLILPVPVLTPRLSSYWIHLVTPVPAYIARPLAEGLKNSAVCKNDDITKLIPQTLLTCEEAISKALQRQQHFQVETHWSDAGLLPEGEWSVRGDAHWSGGTEFKDDQNVLVEASAGEVWHSIIRIGGESGWYYANWLWSIRGLLDKIVGGVGLRKSFRRPDSLKVGDTIDFWRVVALEPEKRMVLAAEMKLPGEALLTFELQSAGPRLVRLYQKARFYPKGLLGLAYWYLSFPLHLFVFKGMINGVKKRALLAAV